MSSFQGIEMAKKALAAQQGGLYTTGHNIANVNTEGYSRQRVNFETTSPFPTPSRVMPQIAGQIGTGVEIGTVQRVRDQFLDAQFRTENSSLGYWNTKSGAITRMEELLNEPSDTGLNTQMDRFWQSLQDLADNPDNKGARSVVAHRGLALAETFNHLSRSLNSIQADLKEQIDVSTKNVNSLLTQINDLNKQIQKIEPHGMLANDLYDDRDRLIDQLSQHMNIKVHRHASSDSSLKIADGLVSIEVLDSSGNRMNGDDGVFLIDANPEKGDLDDAVNEISILPGKETQGAITEIKVENHDGNLLGSFLKSNGSFKALIESHGHVKLENGQPVEVGDDEKPPVVGLYPEMLADLDRMAKEFAKAFNAVHSLGEHLEVDEQGNPTEVQNFFVNKDGTTNDDDTGITAGTITINSEILSNSDLIAAGEKGAGSSNGNNALELAKVFDVSLNEDENNLDNEYGGANLCNTSVRKFYTALIGEMGVKGQEAKSMKDSTGVLRAQVENSRMSVSAVSLDEEMSNLIKFQHAYNAAARSMTATDELLDKIINQMGLVGR